MEDTNAAAADAGTASEDMRPEDEARAAATQPDADATEGEDAAPEGAEGEAEQPEEEEEFRFGAKALKLRKGLLPEDAAAALREFTEGVQGDYTRKTQALAEQARAVQAERENVAKMAALSSEVQKAAVAAEVFDAQAKALRQQLPALWQSDPDQARRASDEAAMYEAAAVESRNQVAKHQAEWTAEQQRTAAKLLEAGQAEVRAAIKGFDAKAESDLIRYAVEQYGVPEADAKNYGLTPKVAVAMWKAMQWDRLQTAAKGATAPKQPAAPSAPVKAIASKGTAPVGDDALDDEAYFRKAMSEAARKARR